MIKITTAARIWLAKEIQGKPLFLAWGEGDATWTDSDKTPQAVESVSALHAEIARRKVVVAGYVIADATGDIQTPDGNYRLSVDPTETLYFKCTFDFTDNPTATIRELGLFMDGEVDASLPAGQDYFIPSQVTAPGVLLGAARLDAEIARSSNTRHVFEFVLPILS